VKRTRTPKIGRIIGEITARRLQERPVTAQPVGGSYNVEARGVTDRVVAGGGYRRVPTCKD
jgi:hypothetical protein